MKVSLRTSNDLSQFICSNKEGNSITLGENDAVGPMEAVLMSIAGCSTIDIIMILKKMRQEVRDVQVKVKAKRSKSHPKVFTKIKLSYKIYGKVKEAKAEKAIDISLNKYCSVSQMIEKSAKIIAKFEIIEK